MQRWGPSKVSYAAVNNGPVTRQDADLSGGGRQVRDAVIAMLDAWTGEKGRVAAEKLAGPLVDATLAGPKASPDAKVCCRHKCSWPGLSARKHLDMRPTSCTGISPQCRA